ncbi:MAG: acetyl-CoA carboxylase biotin carboxyl carrier protein [Candidatus Limnocylindrales bacterium]
MTPPERADEPTSDVAADVAAERRSDAAAVERLADELLPALIAHFNASGLGELEIRRGDWRVRLRAAAGKPAAVVETADLAASTQAGRKSPRPVASLGAAAAPGPVSGNGQTPDAAATGRQVAHSPGVGYFSPRDGLAAGSAVRAGDVLGHVDVLGIQVEVVSPEAGFVARVMADRGQAVEYGQDLVRLETSQPPAPARES